MSFPADLDIPAWVEWLAQDSDGNWWGYSAEPQQHHDGWYENEVGDCIRLASGPANAQWQSSLVRVTEIPSRNSNQP